MSDDSPQRHTFTWISPLLSETRNVLPLWLPPFFSPVRGVFVALYQHFCFSNFSIKPLNFKASSMVWERCHLLLLLLPLLPVFTCAVVSVSMSMTVWHGAVGRLLGDIPLCPTAFAQSQYCSKQRATITDAHNKQIHALVRMLKHLWRYHNHRVRSMSALSGKNLLSHPSYYWNAAESWC